MEYFMGRRIELVADFREGLPVHFWGLPAIEWAGDAVDMAMG